MSIEEALAANTAALIANTEAHARLADVATAAAGGKTTKPPEDEAPKETAAAKKKRLAAEKKAKEEAESSNDAEPPELASSVTQAALKKAGAAFMDTEDEDVRDTNKANFIGGLAHLGAKKLGDLETGEDRARLAAYIAYWEAGLKVDFEAIDEILADQGEGEGDDLLG